MATEQLINNLKKEIDRIKKLDKDQLVARPKWGEINFEDCRLNIERTYGVVEQLSLLPVSILPDNTVQQISQKMSETAQAFESLDKFSLGASSNVANEKQMHAGRIRASTDEFFSVTATWLPYLAYQRGDVERNIKALTSSVSNAEKLVGGGKERIEAMMSEMENIIIKAREASAAAGAAVFTQDFERISKTHEKDAASWLKISGIAAILTVLAAAAMWKWSEAGLDQGQLLQKLSTKLVVLAVLLSGTLWCARNYKALKHLATINRHRSLSIQTLQAFSAAASDVQTKDAVLLEATRAVFGHVNTGYINDSGGDGDLKIVEIARGILPRGDKV
jgi:hypothetical protein